MSGAISVDGCVQISVDTFIDEMNGEKILTQNEMSKLLQQHHVAIDRECINLGKNKHL